MVRLIFSLLIAVLIAFGITSARADFGHGPREDIVSGLWSGGTYYDDDTGLFLYCYVSAGYDDDYNILFLMFENHELELGYGHDDWDVDANDNFYLGVRIDDFFARENLLAEGYGGFFGIYFGQDFAAIDAFSRGYNLFVLDGKNDNVPFKLDGTAAAIAALTECVDIHVGPQRPSKTRN